MAKAKTVTKSDLVDRLAEKTGASKKDTKNFVDSFIDELTGSMGKGRKVQLTGFGTFEVRTRRARMGVKPGTTQKIRIPATKYPAFKPGKALKDQVKS